MYSSRQEVIVLEFEKPRWMAFAQQSIVDCAVQPRATGCEWSKLGGAAANDSPIYELRATCNINIHRANPTLGSRYHGDKSFFDEIHLLLSIISPHYLDLGNEA